MKHEKRNILKGVLAFSMAILMFMTAIPTTLQAAESEERYFSEKEPLEDYAYSFAVVGDTQNMTANDVGNGKEHLKEMYKWIVDNKDEKNIQYVFGLGDITAKTDVNQWNHAEAAIKQLDGQIPYSVIRGNHDLPGQYGDKTDKTDYFTQKLGTETYKNQFPEDGFYEADNIFNSWRTLTVGNIDYLLLALDYAPSDEVLAWASDIIEQHPYHNVIITTHEYLSTDGTLSKSNLTSSGGVNNGNTVWNQLVSQHENIVLVLCGHNWSSTGDTGAIVVSRDEGAYGNVVTSMMINPQDVDANEGSTGMVAMLYFSEDGRKVQVEYYSTVHKKYFLEENQFSFELEDVDEVLAEVTSYNAAYAEVKLESGAKIMTSENGPTYFGEPPAYLKGLYFIQKQNISELTATVTADCYAYILADERSVTSLEEAGFTQLQTYTKQELWQSGYHLTNHTSIPNKLCLFEKRVEKGDTITYGKWAILMTSRKQLTMPLVEVTNAGTVKWAEVELQDGAKIFSHASDNTVFQNTPAYLKGLYFIHKNTWSSLTVTANVDCYAYVLADENLVETLENAGFTHVRTYKKTDIWNADGYYTKRSDISTELCLLEKQVVKGETITYGDDTLQKWAILMTSRKPLTMPLAEVTSYNAAYAEVKLESGAKIMTSENGPTYFGEPPAYLKGLYFIQKQNISELTATVTADCYAYILADDRTVTSLEEAGFTQLQTYTKKELWHKGYHLTNHTSIPNKLCLFEKRVEKGDTITYGKWAILMTSRTQLETPPMLKGNSVTLDGEIGINYYVYLNNALAADTDRVTMQFTLPNSTEPMVVNECTWNSDYDAYVFTCDIPAKHMADEIVAQVYVDGVACDDEYTLSVMEYGNTLLNDSTQSEEIKNLVKNMLHYGAYSQIYFDYNVNARADAGLEALDLTAVTQSNFEKTIKTEEKGFGKITTANLNLKAGTSLNLYLQLEDTVKEEIADYTFTCNGVVLETGEFNELLSVKIPNIAAHELDEIFTIEATKSGESESSATFKFSVFSYAHKALEPNANVREGLTDLMKAMYLYNSAAKDLLVSE